jgi:hypothetical protein
MYKKLAIGMLFVMTTSLTVAQPIVTDSTSNSTTNSTSETTVKSPPPTAVAPAVTTVNNDVCAVVASGAVQTQIFGISMGGTMRDMNCERIKLSKNLFDMGMKVAAVATLCQDERVFSAMMAAGTPCPVDGKIGAQAKAEWDSRGVSSKHENIGFYNITKEESEVITSTPEIKDATGCDEYTGTDPIVIERVCGK